MNNFGDARIARRFHAHLDHETLAVWAFIDEVVLTDAAQRFKKVRCFPNHVQSVRRTHCDPAHTAPAIRSSLLLEIHIKRTGTDSGLPANVLHRRPVKSGRAQSNSARHRECSRGAPAGYLVSVSASPLNRLASSVSRRFRSPASRSSVRSWVCPTPNKTNARFLWITIGAFARRMIVRFVNHRLIATPSLNCQIVLFRAEQPSPSGSHGAGGGG